MFPEVCIQGQVKVWYPGRAAFFFFFFFWLSGIAGLIIGINVA